MGDPLIVVTKPKVLEGQLEDFKKYYAGGNQLLRHPSPECA